MRTRPHIVSEERIGDQLVHCDEEGYLVDPEEWTPEVANSFAREEGLSLTEEHWSVFEFMRDYLAEHHVAADARLVFKFIGESHGETKKEGRQRFFQLFPYGYTKQACKIAGMRQPRAWSTG